MKAKILLIDDSTSNIEILFDMLNDCYQIFFATNGMKGIELSQSKLPDLILLDIVMPEMDGFEVCKQLKANHKTAMIPVIFLTAETQIETLVKGFESGIVDYLTKPFNASELLARVKTQIALQQQKIELKQKNNQLELLNQQLKQEIQHREKVEVALQNADQKISSMTEQEAKRWKIDAFIGKSPQFLKVLDQIRRLQKVDRTNVLILGESGTGKELVARAIHYGSARKHQPFVTVNCSAIPNELADSAFFGHIKGAFTGAQDNRRGYFETADGGTLFLDELGDLPLLLQTKLLRVLEDRKVMRVGSNTEKKIDVRVIAATNSVLEQRIQDKSFRQDLYYRLTGYTIQLPPLKQRQQDIPLLINHFLKLLSQEMNITKGLISNQAMLLLQNYHFPGNIRELKNIIEHALISSSGQAIQANHLHLIEPMQAVEISTSVSNNQIPEPIQAGNNSVNNEQQILEYLSEYEKINNFQCQQLLSISHHQASYLLKKMNKQGKLKLEGERRWAFYVLP